jgi:hypothetical protein
VQRINVKPCLPSGKSQTSQTAGGTSLSVDAIPYLSFFLSQWKYQFFWKLWKAASIAIVSGDGMNVWMGLNQNKSRA